MHLYSVPIGCELPNMPPVSPLSLPACCTSPLPTSRPAAALLLGAKSAVGTDTDPLAVRAAAANAVLNDCQERFQVLQCGASLADPDPLLQVIPCLDVGWLPRAHAATC